MVAEKVEAADEWQWVRARREAAVCVGQEVEEVDGQEGDDKPSATEAAKPLISERHKQWCVCLRLGALVVVLWIHI